MSLWSNYISILCFLTDLIIIWVIGIYSTIKQLLEKHRKLESAQKRDGHVAIITGGSGGIGKEIIRQLLSLGFHTIIVDRNELTLDDLRKEFPIGKVEYFQLDISSTKSIRDFVQNFLRRDSPLHLLINSAGVMFGPLQLNENGIELQLSTNYLGHFLLTYLLLPKLMETGTESLRSRVVNVSSVCHYAGKAQIDDFKSRKSYSPYASYAESKLYTVMFTILLQDLLYSKNAFVTVNCLHPGVINTNLYQYSIINEIPKFKKLFLKTPEQGADSVMYVALSKEIEGIGGKYFDNCKICTPNRLATKRELQLKLWWKTCEILELKDFLLPSTRS